MEKQSHFDIKTENIDFIKKSIKFDEKKMKFLINIVLLVKTE